MMTMKTKTCIKCAANFDYEPVFVEDREIFEPTFCDSCIQNQEKEAQRAAQEQHDAFLLRVWESICPREYRETDETRLRPAYRHAISRWRFGRKGVGIPGIPGTGKTRTAFLLLKKSHFEHGKACYAVSAKRLAKVAIDQFDRQEDVRLAARTTLHRAHAADVLLIDDLGKGTMSERAEEEFYGILEERTSHHRPTIWTANSNGNELLAKFSADRGEAILRRLTEFSEIV
jgi:hypothetical protein